MMSHLSNGFNREDFPREWKKVVLVLMRYITQDTMYKHFHSQLFFMLNNFRHDVRMNFTFWMFFFLFQSIDTTTSNKFLLLC